jgi:cyclopropane fatty-acyl-phospholipid synthase-like methyltransferase
MNNDLPFEQAPFSQPCENNKRAILDLLTGAFEDLSQVLEIGSGTGQHAVYFAKHLPHLTWHCADQVEYHAGINAWIKEYPTPNIVPPISLKIPQERWPTPNDEAVFDGYFSANTAHIMQKHEVQALMRSIDEHLPADGVFCQYGPFTQNGVFNSQSNADFHQSLIENGYGGYRDLQELQKWAPNLSLTQCIDMPANNLMLMWRRA